MFTSLQNNSSLEEIFQGLLDVIANEKKRLKTARAGLVSGIMNSDGTEHKKRNCELLKKFAQQLRKQYNFPVISSPDIFTDELYERLKKTNIKYEDFDRFWIRLLERGIITDVFMTPRWELSKGATNEHNKATTLQLTIHYLT